MSYGLELTSGSNNNIVIADTQADMSNYVPVEHGFGTKTTVDVDLVRDLVFIRHTPVRGPNFPHDSIRFFYGETDTGQPNPLYEVDENGNPTPATIFSGQRPTIFTVNTQLSFDGASSLEYIILKPAGDVTPVGDYGLQIINKENRVQFDSRAINTEKTIELEEYFPPRSSALLYDIYSGNVTRSDLINSSFNFFYSMNDDIDQSSGLVALTTTSTTRALIFVPTGTSNFQTSTLASPVTIASGVYATQTTVTVGIFGSVSYFQAAPDFIIFRGSLVE